MNTPNFLSELIRDLATFQNELLIYSALIGDYFAANTSVLHFFYNI